jgi:phage gp29-like protein
LPDPDLVLAQQGLGRQELRKLETDDEISAALETRREAVVATPWRLEPYDSEPSQWLWETLAPHMETLIRGAWSAIPYGYAVQEVVYAKGSRIGLERISEKPLEWFEPRRDGTLWYSAPAGSPGMDYVPGIPTRVDTATKFLLTIRTPTYRNPFGEALLSRCYWPWFFRANGWRFWMRFLERFGDPLLLGQVYEPQAFVTTMQALGLDAVVGVGKDEQISAVTSGLAGEFDKVEMALGRRIQKLILGQTLTSEIGDKGSYAAAQVHNQVREDKRRADVRLVTGSVQRLVNALWALNAFPSAAPTFVMQDDTGLEEARAKRDAELVKAGVLTLSEQYLLDRYDFEPGDFTLPATATGLPQAALSASVAAGGSPRVLLASPKPQRFTQDQEAVERLVTAAMDQAASPIPVAKLRATILAATDQDDLMERLMALYGGEEVAAFQNLVERSLFAADVLGYVAAERKVGGG